MKKLSLDELKQSIKPATDPDRIRLPSPNHKKMQRVLSARLVATEYLRNGLDIKKAYEAVTHKKYTPSRFNVMLAEGTSFLEEVNLALSSADVEKNKVLTMLWAMASVSPLDFMDDNGIPLTVAQLKQLPREMQAMIEQVETTTDYEPIKDENGKTMQDTDGKPLLKPVQHVKVRIVKQKKDALTIIAQIGKLIGPTMLQQNNTIFNIGQNLAEADQRRLSGMLGRDPKIIEYNPDDGTSGS